MRSVAKALGVTETSVSFAVSDLFENGAIPQELLADERAQSIIADYIEEASQMAGAPVGRVKLKPLREALEKISGQDVDYIQLRVGIRRYLDEAESEIYAPRPGA